MSDEISAGAAETGVKTVNHYFVEISDGAGLLSERKNVFGTRTLKVLGENDDNIVVEDQYFTTIRKKKSDYFTCLESPVISTQTADRVFGSRIAYCLYTTKRKRASTIRKEIEECIQERFSFYLGKLDLSIIKD